MGLRQQHLDTIYSSRSNHNRRRSHVKKSHQKTTNQPKTHLKTKILNILIFLHFHTRFRAYSVSLSTRKREQDKGKLLAEVTAKRDTKEKSLTQMETGSRKFIEGTSTYQEMKKKKESLGIGEDTDPEVIRTKLLLMDVGEYDPDAEDENDAIL